MLSRLPPNRNIVRFFAEYREHIPEDVYEHLPPVAQVRRALVCDGGSCQAAKRGRPIHSFPPPLLFFVYAGVGCL